MLKRRLPFDGLLACTWAIFSLPSLPWMLSFRILATFPLSPPSPTRGPHEMNVGHSAILFLHPPCFGLLLAAVKHGYPCSAEIGVGHFFPFASWCDFPYTYGVRWRHCFLQKKKIRKKEERKKDRDSGAGKKIYIYTFILWHSHIYILLKFTFVLK